MMDELKTVRKTSAGTSNYHPEANIKTNRIQTDSIKTHSIQTHGIQTVRVDPDGPDPARPDPDRPGPDLPDAIDRTQTDQMQTDGISQIVSNCPKPLFSLLGVSQNTKRAPRCMGALR